MGHGAMSCLMVKGDYVVFRKPLEEAVFINSLGNFSADIENFTATVSIMSFDVAFQSAINAGVACSVINIEDVEQYVEGLK